MWGVLGWAVACGDDGAGGTTTEPDADVDGSSPGITSVDGDGGQTSVSTGDRDPSGPVTLRDSAATDVSSGAHSSNSAEPAPERDAGTTRAHDASSAGCSNECELDAVRCSGEGADIEVDRCVFDATRGCNDWQPVADCEHGSCVGELTEGACDGASESAKCADRGLVVCAPGPAGCPIWQRPPETMYSAGDVEIDEGATAFMSYGVLGLTLTGDVGTEGLVACLTDLRDAASAPDDPAVLEIDARGSGEYELTLSRYQLPVAYQLEVALGSEGAVRSVVVAPDVLSRVAFVSAATGSADLRSLASAVGDDPLAAADAVCNAEAEAAGLAGEFRAFLSVEAESGVRDATDAICRLRGGEGVASEDCGVQPPSDAQASAPYLDMRGLPIIYGTADVEAGHWRLPIGYRADGSASEIGTAAWTGSDTRGRFARSDCLGWTSADEGERGNAAGNPGVTFPSDTYSLACDDVNAILCFASGEGHPLARTHERPGKAAFIVELAENSEVDAAAANQACEETFGGSGVVAWFSDETQDAACSLAGLVGKVDDDCGEASVDAVGPWVRADGYLVAETLQELSSGPRAPINLGFEGAFAAPNELLELVRTDTRANGGRGAVSANVPCISGDRTSIASGWTYFTNSCDSVADFRPFVYCFER